MSKDNASRRDFLKSAALLATSGALGWGSDARGSVEAALEAVPQQDRVVVLRTEMGMEQPFAPYYLDPYSDMWNALWTFETPRMGNDGET